MTPLLLLAALAGPRGATPVTFVGFDYSLVRMYGTTDFDDPAAIFPGYLEKWNVLWLTEKVEATEQAIGPVTWSFDTVRPVNLRATAEQIERKDGGPELVEASHITPEVIAEQVRGYEMPADPAFGLVVIVDRLVKTRATGCAWIVYFDVATRGVRTAERVCEPATGFGFRNYWFNPLKEMLDDMRRLKP